MRGGGSCAGVVQSFLMARSWVLRSPSGIAQACIAQFTCQLRNTFLWTRRSGLPLFLLSQHVWPTWARIARRYFILFYYTPCTLPDRCGGGVWQYEGCIFFFFLRGARWVCVNERRMKRSLCSPLQPAVVNLCASSGSRLEASRLDSSSHD